MKIVLAFDSFKGCMSASEACHTAAEAIHQVLPLADIVQCPLSDGGEGLVDCISEILPSKRITIHAHDPLMNPIKASYVISSLRTLSIPLKGERTAGEGKMICFIEMAYTSGLTLVPPDKRNPMLTTTYGVGEMIADALNRGCTHIVIGIGGSATCDGGRGMIQCLKEKGIIQTVPNYSSPFNLAPTFGVEGVTFTVACDVTNPLYGPNGAAYIFAPQKGATPEQVVELDKRLRDFALETERLGLATPQLAQYPGAGAAGGLGYGLMAYLKATLKSGIDIILDINHFDYTVKDADIVITGEGKSDPQTLMGKVPSGVLKRIQRAKQSDPAKQVWLLSGAIDDPDGQLSRNFNLVRSINHADNRPLDILMQSDVAKANLKKSIINNLSYLYRI